MVHKSKDVVVGLGEIGKPILQLLSKNRTVVGYDINEKLMNKKNFDKLKDIPTEFLHICIPYSKKFIQNLLSIVEQFDPNAIVIHSTIEPYTTQKLQQRLFIPVIYSATRGVHKRMIFDLKRYTKFFAIEKNVSNAKWAATEYKKIMNGCDIKTKQMSSPITLELAKIICDTSYYGWLINYAQLSNIIAKSNKVDYDEMWSFADEIHKFLGNRPKMYPGIIGGHCVIPNLELINVNTLNFIKTLNKKYIKKISIL